MVDTVVDPGVETKVEEPVETKVEEPVKIETKTEEPSEPIKSSPEPKVIPKVPPEEWAKIKMQQRIDRLTAEKRQLEAAVAAKQQGGAAPTSTDDAAMEAKVNALADAKAQQIAVQIAAQRNFDERCETVVNDGRTAYADFNDSIKTLKEVADLDNPIDAAKYTAFIDAIIETGDGPRLIHELASDPSEAERIFKLSPVKQGIALAKLAAMEAPASTAAPKPITPVGNRAGSRIPITPDDVGRADNLSTAEWMARRNQQVEEQRKTRRGY